MGPGLWFVTSTTRNGDNQRFNPFYPGQALLQQPMSLKYLNKEIEEAQYF
jgi:hypothetical protein